MTTVKTPTVSIVIPVYNSELYLEECLSSVLNLTFQEYEVILINDGSTDRSLDICEKYAKDQTKIHVVNKQNGGVSSARNEGIKIATGEWVMFLDADDSLNAGIMEELLALPDNRTDIVACCCKVFSDASTDVDYFFGGDRIFETDDDKIDLFKQLLDGSYGQPGKTYTAIGVPWGKLYRRRFLIENNLFFNQELKRLQDNIFNMYAFELANKIKYINKPLYNYRVDHIKQYYTKNPQEVIGIFHSVAKERYICMNEFGMFNNIELLKYYQMSVLKNIIASVRFGVFLNVNLEHSSERRQLLRQIRGIEYFDKFFTETSKRDFDQFKYRLMFFLLKNKCLRMLRTVMSYNKMLNA